MWHGSPWELLLCALGLILCLTSYGSIPSSVEPFLTSLSPLTCQRKLQVILVLADLLGNSLKPSSGPFPQFFWRRNRTISPVGYPASVPLKCKSVESNFTKNSLCIVCDRLRKQIHATTQSVTLLTPQGFLSVLLAPSAFLLSRQPGRPLVLSWRHLNSDL